MRPLVALAALVAAMAALLIAYGASPVHAAGSCSTTAAGTTTCTFDTPGTSTWDVPEGVTQAAFDVFGAQGGGTLIYETSPIATRERRYVAPPHGSA
jgi:hypothetical protein